MELSSALVKEFASVVNDTNEEVTSSGTAYGTIVSSNGVKYVLLDGASSMTAISEATDAWEGDRVIVTITNHVATVTSNLTSPASGRTATAVSDELTAYYDYINANYITADKIEANYASYNYLATNYLDVTQLEAEYATIKYLDSTFATIEYLTSEYITANEITAQIVEAEEGLFEYVNTQIIEAQEGYFEYLDVYYLTAEYIEATYIEWQEAYGAFATLDDLEAAHASISNLDATMANIQALLAGQLGAEEGQFIHLTVDNVIIDDAVIVDAMIASVTADKIQSGTIYTSKVTIQTAEGDASLHIDNSTIQITDKNQVTRVQIGEDASQDYNLYLWDANANLLWNAKGLTEAGVEGNGGIIKDMAVADDANIQGHKLDIHSVASSLNTDGSLIVDASNVVINDTTLDVAYTEIYSYSNDALAAAVEAQNTANAAQSAADSAAAEAQAAQSTADQAQADAASAQSAADQAKANADNAQAAADQAQKDYDDLASRTDVTEEELAEAQKKLEQAQADASSAADAAKSAQSAADSAAAEAQAAQSTADAAKSAADSAAADAKAAQSTADEAMAAVENAEGEISNIISQVTVLQTEFTVINGLIEGEIWKSDITAAVDAATSTITETITDQWTNTVQLVDSVSTQVGQLQTTADSLSSQVTEITTTVDGIKTNITDIQTNLTSTTSKVNTISETVDGMTQTIINVQNDLSGISQQVTTIEANVNGISTTVSSVQAQLDNLEIGARNLSLDTELLERTRLDTSVNYIKESYPYFKTSDYGFSLLQEGGSFTVSFDYEINNITTAVTAQINLGQTNTSYGSVGAKFDLKVGNNSGHVSTTFVPSSGQMEYGYKGWLLTDFGTGCNEGAEIKISHFKLEKGTVETDWTLAPEDVTAEISEAQSAVVTAQKAADDAASAAAKAQAEYEDLASRADTTDEELSAAKKAADDAQAAADAAQKDVDAAQAALKEAQAKLSELADEITNVSSSITQLANSISLTVTDGKLGSTAGITISIGGSTTSETLDLSDVREAWAEDKSNVEVKGGTITFNGGQVIFNSGTFVVNSDNFSVDETGYMVAKSGTVGGFNMSATKLYGHNTSGSSDGQPSSTNKTAMAFQIPTSSNTWALAIGSSTHSSYSDAVFRVDKYGNMYSESCTIYNKISIYNSERGTTDTITGYYNSETYGIQIGSSSSRIVYIPGELNANGGIVTAAISASGRITINTTNSSGIYYTCTGSSVASCIDIVQNWSGRHISLQCGSGGTNRGVYDNGDGAWIIYRGSDDVRSPYMISSTEGNVTAYYSPYGVSLCASSAGNEGLYDRPTSASSKGWILRYVRDPDSDNKYSTFLPQVPNDTSSSSANVRMGSSGKVQYISSSSSIRYKDVIREMEYSEVNKYFSLPIHWFTYKSDYLKEDDERYMVQLPGFLAEEWNDLLPAVVDHNENGQCEVWNPRFVTPIMFEMIKYNHTTIESVEDRVDGLELEIASLRAENDELKQQLAALQAA